MSRNTCIYCNKLISRKAKRCTICSKKGKNNPNYKDGLSYDKQYRKVSEKKCIDCFKNVNNESTRCKTCYIIKMKKNHPRYIDGRSSEIFLCVDCKIKISRNKIRCKRCKHNNQSIILRGKNSHFYKDGRTSLKELIRGLNKYSIWRTSVFQRDNYSCVECGITSTGNIEADHIRPFSFLIGLFLSKYNMFSPIEDKETLIRLSESYAPLWDINNGRTLCESCHKKTDTYAEKAKNYKE